MTRDILVYSIGLFVTLFGIGTLLCVMLYRWDYQRFFGSTLWVKIYYWIPIFTCFLIILYLQLWAAVIASVLIASFALRELLRIPSVDWTARIYALTVSLASAHLVLIFLFLDTHLAVQLLLLVGFCGVLSDVCAYFMGNFIGRHKLPYWINQNKSWEGVAGQIAGAILGYILIAPVLQPAPSLVLAILIGIASAAGDILNSVIKRRVGIKDWGNTIPGHGGVLDRFASLSFAIAVSFWWVIVT